MTNAAAILDQVLSLTQSIVESETTLKWAEPLLVNPVRSAGVSYRALTILKDDTAIAVFGITNPQFALNTAQFYKALVRRALARKAPYLILTNLRETIMVLTPKKADTPGDILRRYPLLELSNAHSITALSNPETLMLDNLLNQVFSDFDTLHKEGHLFLEVPDADYFVARLVKAVDVLKPAVKKALLSEVSIKPDFSKELIAWALPQGIPVDLKSEGFAEAVARQAIYRLLGKIIFYQSLRRARSDLPEFNLGNLDTSQVLPHLYGCFSKAHEIDYHAVFREDIIDRLPYPTAASAELRSLVEDLNTRDFAHLPQDVVGAVFEQLIPTEDRHALGQFFTPEPLVDLISTFCVRDAKDKVLDPTCGTGTFLIRSYNRLQTALGVYDHSQLLEQLWGVDIAPFPAELATINLFRQQVEDSGNFPRILNDDFFNIIPGGRYRFPPLKADSIITAHVNEVIPQFDAIIGNFPYIGASRIEQVQKGYLKQSVFQRLVEDWFKGYPAGFQFVSKNTQHEYELAVEKGLSLEPYKLLAEPDISSNADIYVYLFWHAAAFLKPGGRMGIITSNAWLDVGFGYALQRFFVNNFKIIAIIESRCEPWFEQAAVNTVVTILERCENTEERDIYPVHFVKIKQPLRQIIPWDMRLDALNRWLGIQHLVRQVEDIWEAGEDPQQPLTWENDAMRVRSVRQRALRRQVESVNKTSKWGPYLRAPVVYFDFLNQVKDKLALIGEIAPSIRGGLTGINEFFHVDDQTIKEFSIEEEFTFPLLKSASDNDKILISQEELRLKIFVCRQSKDDLTRQGNVGALSYIQWGEKQKFTSGPQNGLTWPNGSTVKNRKPGWYSLPESMVKRASVFLSSAIGNRHLCKFTLNPIIADKRLYFLNPASKIPHKLIAAIMNSSISALLIEVLGRVSLGDGALEITVEDVNDYLLVPDATRFDDKGIKAIESAFHLLYKRSIRSVFEEVNQADRQALDFAVLEAMGLNPDTWLPRIYDGLTALVRERTNLGKMRSQSRRSHTQKTASKTLEDVIEELLPERPKPFPESFFSAAALSSGFREIQLPPTPIRYAGHMFGKEELISVSGEIIQVNNPAEVQFLLFTQAAGKQVACIPQQPVECSRTVNDYKRYLRDLRKQLQESYFRRTLDQAQAERLTIEAWRKLALPILED